MPIPPFHEPSTTSTPPSPSKWGPYSGPGDFSINMVIILIILFCTLFLVLALNAVIRHLISSFRLRSRRGQNLSDDPEKQMSGQKSPCPTPAAFPVLVYSAATKLAGTEAECSICLAEFVEGDSLRVLPACNHGFHVSCIEKWVSSKKSCPTCRASCGLEAV